VPVDISLLIRQRLSELGSDQKALAAAAQVTESYISQLLARKKAPPAPGRTDIYEKISLFLGLPAGELARLAEAERQLELKKRVAEPPQPLFKDCRDLVLRKCRPDLRREIRRIFEKEPFGEFERLVTRKILDVTQGAARENLGNEAWLRSFAPLSGHSFEQLRVALLEFLDTDIFQISSQACVSFLDPMIDAWSIDLKSFGMEIELNRRLTPRGHRTLEFIERIDEKPPRPAEPGLEKFLRDSSLSGDASTAEIVLLKALTFGNRRPTALYYYRELQSLRDPLHFTFSAEKGSL
jgi:transcriptional regulator with XRE-family HTH domain